MQRRNPRARNQKGLTLVELIVAFTILAVLSVLALPLASLKIRTERQRDLRYALTQMRTAIDKYKDNCDQGYFGPPKLGTNCYPETLEILVEGQKLAQSADGKKLRLLRHIPKDPITNTFDWGLRSDQDDVNSTSWGGQDVFDIYTKSTD